MAADYTNAEILNELSRIFRAGIEPGREGGTANTQVEYQQLLDSASLTFLLQNDAIFYLARLARNNLNALVVQEIRIVEDILLALDHLGQIGQPVRDTTILSNANTALLSLDAAGSVKDRPEAARFSIQMDRFAALNRGNIVSSGVNELVRPKEEARGIITTNWHASRRCTPSSSTRPTPSKIYSMSTSTWTSRPRCRRHPYPTSGPT